MLPAGRTSSSLDRAKGERDNSEMFLKFARNKSVIRFLSLAIVTLTVVTTFTDDADARRRRRRRSRVKRTVINEPKLYERLGGSKGVNEVVDLWAKTALADVRLEGAFGDVSSKPDLALKFKKTLVEQICELADGPCTSKVDPKKPLDLYLIPEPKFVVFADHLVSALDARVTGEREKNEILGRFGAARLDSLPDSEAESEPVAEPQ